MAITITANLDASGVKIGASQVSEAIQGVADTADKSGDSLQDFAQETLAKINDLREGAEKLNRDIADLGFDGHEAFNRVEMSAEEARRAIVEMDKAAENRDKIKTVAVAWLGVTAAVKAAWEVGEKFNRFIRDMAANGNAAARDVADSFDRVSEKWDRMLSSETAQKKLGAIATLAGSVVSPAIDKLGASVGAVDNAIERYITNVGDFLGILSDGAAKANEEIIATSKAAEEARLKQIDADKAAAKEKALMAPVERELDKLKEARAIKDQKAAIDEIESTSKLKKLIEEETESLRTRQRAQTLSDADRVLGIEKIKAAEQRIEEIRRKADEENWQRVLDLDRQFKDEVKQIEEVARKQQDAAKEADRVRKEQADAIAKQQADELANFQRLQKAKLDAERQAIDERKRLLGGPDVEGAKNVIGAQSREQVRAAFAMDQGQQVEQEARQRGLKENQIAKERQKAMEIARRQFDSGQADPVEVRRVQEEFANSAINAAARQGKISRDTAIALKEGVAEMANVQNELDTVRDEIAQIRKLTQGAVLQGQRRRAQVAGAGR